MVAVEGVNSYISEADADTYFSNRLYTDVWDNNVCKSIALIQACSLMENRVFWKGAKASKTQSLQWPRAGLTDHYRTPVPNGEIPNLVKQVQCELALYILENDPHLVPGGIESIGFAGLKINTNPKPETIPGKIFKPVSHWGELIDNRNHRLTR